MGWVQKLGASLYVEHSTLNGSLYIKWIQWVQWVGSNGLGLTRCLTLRRSLYIQISLLYLLELLLCWLCCYPCCIFWTCCCACSKPVPGHNFYVVSYGTAVVLGLQQNRQPWPQFSCCTVRNCCCACSKTIPGHIFHVVSFGTAVVLAAKPSLAASRISDLKQRVAASREKRQLSEGWVLARLEFRGGEVLLQRSFPDAILFLCMGGHLGLFNIITVINSLGFLGKCSFPS